MDIDNEVLVSGSGDNKIQVWKMTSSSQLFEGAHEDVVECVKVVDNLVLSCADKTLRIWNLRGGNLLQKLHLPQWCRNFDLNSEKTVLAIAHDEGVSIWDYSKRNKIMEIELHQVNDVRFNEAGTKLIVGQFNGQVSRIDLY